jgi:hypothetical protein
MNLKLPVYKLWRGKSTERGTLGTISHMGKLICYTLERPWRNNERGVSSIPTGSYTVVPHSGPRFKNVWRLENVPGREAILIHAGNSIADTQGCILVGLQPSPNGVSQSQAALTMLRRILPEKFILEVEYKV